MKTYVPSLLAAVIGCLLVGCAGVRPLPAAFRNNQIFVHPETSTGTVVEFFTDTGGGWNAIRKSDAARLGLKIVEQNSIVGDDGKVYSLVAFPDFKPQKSIPLPGYEDWLHGCLVAVDDGELATNGVFGSRWFAGHVWEFDYIRKTLIVLPDGRAIAKPQSQARLGFRSGRDGTRDLNFPRITISVDNEPLEMLLDTGATARLTVTSANEYHLPVGSEVGASYITQSTFERWARKHPDWKVIDAGESVTGHAFPMILVPRVTIAGLTVGPVWFTQRPDSEFKEWMSQSTDKQIEGAIGGSVLKYFRMVVDYPNAMACFWCPPAN